MCKYISLETYDFTWYELWCHIFNASDWNFKKFCYRFVCVTLFYFVLHYIYLFVKVKITLPEIIVWVSRSHKHHDFVMPRFALLLGFGYVHLFWVIRNDTLW